MKEIYFDVLVKGMFVFQMSYKYCPAFPLDMEDVLTKVVARRPTLRGKRIELHVSNQKVR